MAQVQRGFTLLELMLVLALAGILGAIAIPAYQGMVDRSNTTRAVSDIGSIGLRLAQYELNHGAFPATLAEAGLDGALDPWGRPYAYLPLTTANMGMARKDKNLFPINSDFDLYSPGKDGLTRPPLTAQVSQDDIVRANSGGYIGRAEDY